MSIDVSHKPWTAAFSNDELQTYENYRRPDRTAFPWASCALLVIDVTNEFLGPNISPLQASRELRTACGKPAWDALDAIGTLLKVFRQAGRPVIYTKGSTGRLGGAAIGAVDPLETSEIAEAIAPKPEDLVITKPKASAFFGTPLTTYLIREGIAGLLAVGGSTSGCVRATAVDGSSLGFVMSLAYDGCFDRSPLSHAVALHELDVKYASVVDSRAAIENLRTAGSN